MHKMLTNKGLSIEHNITYNGKLKNIIKKCLEVDPNRRYTSVSDLNKKLLYFLSKKKRVARKVRNILCIMAIVLFCFWMFETIAFERIFNYIYDEKDVLTATSEITSSDIPTATDVSSITENENSVNTNVSFVDQDEINQDEFNQESIQNNTRETALSIELEQKLIDSCLGGEATWYKFATSSNDSIYRISTSPIDAPTNMLFPYLTVAVYDYIGIKLEEFNVWSDDECGFIDLKLQPNTEYFLKINLGGRFDYGDYEMIVSEKVCDAGLDKENATKLVLGEQSIAKLDSTFSDWYAFQVPQDGEYTFTIHNIDVGCEIYFSKQTPRNSGEGMCVSNEDNYSGSIINVQKGELVYFEIYPYNKNQNANGKYIIVIEKVDE